MSVYERIFQDALACVQAVGYQGLMVKVLGQKKKKITRVWALDDALHDHGFRDRKGLHPVDHGGRRSSAKFSPKFSKELLSFFHQADLTLESNFLCLMGQDYGYLRTSTQSASYRLPGLHPIACGYPGAVKIFDLIDTAALPAKWLPLVPASDASQHERLQRQAYGLGGALEQSLQDSSTYWAVKSFDMFKDQTTTLIGVKNDDDDHIVGGRQIVGFQIDPYPFDTIAPTGFLALKSALRPLSKTV